MFSGAVPVKDRTDLIQWDNLLEGKFLEEARQMLEEPARARGPSPCPSRRRPTPRCSARSAAWRTWATTSPRRTSSSRWRSTRSGRIASIDLQVLNARVFKALAEAPKIAGHPYWSCVVYESFEQYLQNAQLCEYPDYRLPGREELFDRVHAGWLGEIIGSGARHGGGGLQILQAVGGVRGDRRLRQAARDPQRRHHLRARAARGVP